MNAEMREILAMFLVTGMTFAVFVLVFAGWML